MEFDSTRFLGENGKNMIKYLAVFGTMCPGKFITSNMLLIIMSFIIENNIEFRINDIDKDLLNPEQFNGKIPLSGSRIKA